MPISNSSQEVQEQFKDNDPPPSLYHAILSSTCSINMSPFIPQTSTAATLNALTTLYILLKCTRCLFLMVTHLYFSGIFSLVLVEFWVMFTYYGLPIFILENIDTTSRCHQSSPDVCVSQMIHSLLHKNMNILLTETRCLLLTRRKYYYIYITNYYYMYITNYYYMYITNYYYMYITNYYYMYITNYYYMYITNYYYMYITNYCYMYITNYYYMYITNYYYMYITN